jgi:hypothetical protein
MLIRITETICSVEEVSYDVELPTHVFHEAQGESVEDYRDDWKGVHRQVLRKSSEITSVEEQ